MRRSIFLTLVALAVVGTFISIFQTNNLLRSIYPSTMQPEAGSGSVDRGDGSIATAESLADPYSLRIDGDSEMSEHSRFRSFHSATAKGFADAPGFGRIRGGAHVLIDAGDVTFLAQRDAADSDPPPDHRADSHPNNAPSAVSPYGLWGPLGTRAGATDRNENVDDTHPDPPSREERTDAVNLETTRSADSPVPPVYYTFGFANLSPAIKNDPTFPWTLAEIQLVSLRRDRVYLIGDNITHMEELSGDTPYRELDSFEHVSLGKLIAGESIVLEKAGTETRMFGAIRGDHGCIRCHQDARDGELLGAFTYRFASKK